MRVYTCGSPRDVARAWADGLKWQYITSPNPPYIPGDMAVWGLLRGAGWLRQACREAGYNYYAMDHAYVGRLMFYRITKNGFQNTSLWDCPSDRWERLRIQLKPWRTTGNHILLCESSPRCYDYLKAWAWREETIAELKRYTNRRIVVRDKKSDRTLDADLKDAWAVVTHVSACAVDAILRGIPAIVTGPSVARPLSAKLSDIEDLPLPDREKWCNSLAYSQFTEWEMRNGKAKAILDEHNVEYDHL